MIKYLKDEKFEDEIKDGVVLVDFYGVEVSKKVGLMSKEELTEWISSNK